MHIVGSVVLCLVRYTANGNDPNAGSAQIPAGTTVAPFMVIKYRTEVSCVGELFTGVGGGATGGTPPRRRCSLPLQEAAARRPAWSRLP